ncbi:hypothetical protein KAJ89_03175 [Candidatus Parcubacteria bacterium]|nr:hypothetical protein [Candidatus Parcubacteria bacterium]
MINLNIISQELKKEINTKTIYLSYKNLLAIIFITLTFYTSAYLGCLLILQIHFVETVKDTSLITRGSENYSAQVRQLNSALANIESIQSEYTNWSYLFEFLHQLSNKNININNINVNKKNAEISLSGIATTRDSLLQLKEKLEESNYFTKINLPIKNLLEKENINFEINSSFKTYEFK